MQGEDRGSDLPNRKSDVRPDVVIPAAGVTPPDDYAVKRHQSSLPVDRSPEAVKGAAREFMEANPAVMSGIESEFEDTEAGRREAAEFVTTTLETVVAENRELRERVNALIDNADRFFVDLHADAINQLAASMKRVAELEGRDGAFAKRFPGEVDRIGTHYDDCYRQHPACAYLLAIHDMKEADRA